MYCLRCGYYLRNIGSSSQCPECGRAFDVGDPSTFGRSDRAGLVPRTILQWVWTVVCLGAISLPIGVLAGVHVLWTTYAGVSSVMAVAGPLGAILLFGTLLVVGEVPEMALQSLLVVAALAQWGPLWALGMRSLSPRRRPRRRTFVIVLMSFAISCVVSCVALVRLMSAAYGA